MKKRIYFRGYYGYKNTGDDIFCVTADWICNELWSNTKPIFIGKDLPKLSNLAIKYQIKKYEILKFYELFASLYANNIIFFGGSALHKIHGLKDIKYYLGKIPFFNSKLGTIGTSIGPFKSDKDYNSIKQLLSKFKFIAVRDYSSLDKAKQMGLESNTSFSFDLAVLITDVFPSLKKKSKKDENSKIKLAVSLCHYERYNNGNINNEIERENAIEQFINDIVNSYDNIDEIVFFEFNGNENVGDLEIITTFNNKIKNKVNTRIVNYTNDTEEFCSELNKCDFLIGTRLHSGILAYSLSIPFMLVEYHNKCTEFLNTINHKYRFSILDPEENLENFKLLLELDEIPNLVKPEYFQNILIEQINLLRNKL